MDILDLRMDRSSRDSEVGLPGEASARSIGIVRRLERGDSAVI
jgi:hypothetical protein